MIHISRKAVYDQACPECGARPGDPCVTTNEAGSMLMATFHTARVEGAKSAAVADASASSPAASDVRPESPLLPPRRRRVDPLAVVCDVCGAPPGQPCWNAIKGEPRDEPHAFRKTAARMAERGVEEPAP